MSGSGKGAAWTVALGLAATALSKWRDSRQSKKAIVRLFDHCFVGDDGFLKPDAPLRLQVADLEFTIGEEQAFRGSRKVRYRRVTVQNAALPGGDPWHLRHFYFLYGWRFHDHEAKLAIAWGRPGNYLNYRRG